MNSLLPLFLFFLIVGLNAQQIPDTSRFFHIEDPEYPEGQGPAVMIDGAHHNFHMLDGRYAAFGNILKADGYRLTSNEEVFTKETLDKCHILVISNAIHESNLNGNWRLPNPSAFTQEEIDAVHEWVSSGGRLFLIADHMPFAGAAADLATSFGITYLNCFAMKEGQGFDYFTRAGGSLADHEITGNGALDSIITFTGSAFKLPEDAEPVISLTDDYTLLSPEVAWEFDEKTERTGGTGWFQLACLSYGRGRIVVSGEAAMFSAQLAGPQQAKMGLNNPAARQNIPLLLNIVHWLD